MAEILARHKRWLWVQEQGPDGPREHPVYLDPRLERQIEGYFALMEARPDAFSPSELYPICTDRRQLLEFEEETGRPAGLVFDNLPYYQTVADLILDETPYLYGRVIYPDPSVGGTVMIPLLPAQHTGPLRRRVSPGLPVSGDLSGGERQKGAVGGAGHPAGAGGPADLSGQYQAGHRVERRIGVHLPGPGHRRPCTQPGLRGDHRSGMAQPGGAAAPPALG